jgi:hypothetical protein
MCQRLYLASRYILPSLRPSRGSAFLSIAPLSEDALPVRLWFSKDAKYFAEARASPCGCGFPELTEFNEGRPPRQDERTVAVAIADYLRGLPGRKSIAELLLCETGEEHDAPRHRRELSLSDITRVGFQFRGGEIIRVGSAGKKGVGRRRGAAERSDAPDRALS